MKKKKKEWFGPAGFFFWWVRGGSRGEKKREKKKKNPGLLGFKNKKEGKKRSADRPWQILCNFLSVVL